MSDFENTESNHPVLQNLKSQIARLEEEVVKEQQLRHETFISKLRYEERVKNVLVEAMEDHDQETVKWIAEQLDISLTVTKQIEVNVTFTIDIEHEIGEEPDPEWDFEYTVSHDSITDYGADVIWNKDVS